MSEGHHTDEQVDKAFAAVPKLLRKLIDAGCINSNVEMFGDASGKVILGRHEDVTDAQIELATDLVKSRRYSFDDGYIGITSCCGFVSFAEGLEEHAKNFRLPCTVPNCTKKSCSGSKS